MQPTIKILLVDDDPFSLKLLSSQLENLGYRNITSQTQPMHALEMIKASTDVFSVIFCDLQMPEMDGVEFVRRLGHFHYAGGLVLVSGEDSRILQTAEKLSRAHNLNVLGALHKPATAEQLSHVLHSFVPQPSQTRMPAAQRAVTDLKHAIEHGELINYYQPKVDLTTGKVIGLETLVRWQHPVDGLIYPDQFIALAEEHNLIDDLTRTVLFSALKQSRIWIGSGLELRVAVNISMDNLGSLEFPDMVANAVKHSGVLSSNLVLEVTESRFMKNPLDALDILARLRLKHIGLSIDDFGTGHSSLVQLRDIPFDELKIDRGFVHGAHANASQRAILEASLIMARQLGMKTVAEGVEDQEDWEFLRDIGCDSAQGYFIGRPMPASELGKWISGWHERVPDLISDGIPD